MEADSPKNILEDAGSAPLFRKLEEMAKNLAGVSLTVLMGSGDDIQSYYPTGGRSRLPRFCTLVRSTTAGRKRCGTCRSLVVFGATYNGLYEYSCHGGISVLAAPIETAGKVLSAPMVVSTCAFASLEHGDGWKIARSHVDGLRVDIRKLKEAYYQLPVLTSGRRHIMKNMIELTALALRQVVQGENPEMMVPPAVTAKRGEDSRSDWEDALRSLLFVSNDTRKEMKGRKKSAMLVDLVQKMVVRDPTMPYNVSSIARAAQMSPNYFSMLFRKHSGMTFVAFLVEKRIRLAQDLLRDLTLNVAQVAYKSGFNDASYFTRKFKQVTGTTPQKWREDL